MESKKAELRTGLDYVLREIVAPKRYCLGITQPGFFQDPHRGDVLRHHQADDPFGVAVTWKACNLLARLNFYSRVPSQTRNRRWLGVNNREYCYDGTNGNAERGALSGAAQNFFNRTTGTGPSIRPGNARAKKSSTAAIQNLVSLAATWPTEKSLIS